MLSALANKNLGLNNSSYPTRPHSIIVYFFDLSEFRIAEFLEGKGGGRKGRFQGKASKLSGRKAVEKLLQDHFTDSLSQ